MSDSLRPHGLQHARLVLSITSSWSLLKLMSIGSVMPSNHLIFCCPLLLLPSVFPSVRVFSNESVLCIRWPKYWSTEEGNGKPYQCSCLENPMNSMKRLFHTSSGVFSLPSQKKTKNWMFYQALLTLYVPCTVPGSRLFSRSPGSS